MTAEIKGARERLGQLIARLENEARALEDGRERHGYGPNAPSQFQRERGDRIFREAADKHAEAQAYHALLAELSRLEGENERLRNELDDALHDYGNAESEAKGAEADNEDLKAALAEARRQIAERAEALKTSSGLLREMRDLVKDHPDFQRRDLVPLGIAVNSALNAAALLSEPAGAKEEEGSDAA